ncbi:hypothetical protein DLH72_02300 [Candidatus Gracilibacteria bacterium]|nr:MAG: hypothetical protein DLH72_02300 [Candidatus Gracilibacteria bacterium]
MKIFGILLIVFGIIIIAFPKILVFLIGGFFIFLGINILAMSGIIGKQQKNQEEYIKFGKYKIYR